jgi:hypothetical protein
MGCTNRDAAARGQSHALNDKIYVQALLMLVNKADETGLALEFSSAADKVILSQPERLRHLKDETWFVFAVCSAEEARVVIMRYLGKKLPPLMLSDAIAKALRGRITPLSGREVAK